VLRIRLSRTGRENFPSYRIVVAEHTSAVKKGAVDLLGHYIPTRTPKILKFDEKKIKEWISKGAKPTNTVASILKNAGVSGMEKYIGPGNRKKKSKKAAEEEAKAAPTAPAPKAEAPVKPEAKEALAEEKAAA
jgi:small subunit ribosomal protein S16